MSGLEAIAALVPAAAQPALSLPSAATVSEPAAGGFASLLAQGLRHVDDRVTAANDLVQRFALDDSVPLHQVTYALEEARLSVELATQVRMRLVDGYRELMNMQI